MRPLIEGDHDVGVADRADWRPVYQEVLPGWQPRSSSGRVFSRGAGSRAAALVAERAAHMRCRSAPSTSHVHVARGDRGDGRDRSVCGSSSLAVRRIRLPLAVRHHGVEASPASLHQPTAECRARHHIGIDNSDLPAPVEEIVSSKGTMRIRSCEGIASRGSPEVRDQIYRRSSHIGARRAVRQCGSGARFATENPLDSPLQAIASRLWGSPTGRRPRSSVTSRAPAPGRSRRWGPSPSPRRRGRPAAAVYACAASSGRPRRFSMRPMLVRSFQQSPPLWPLASTSRFRNL
jgi:hypothetical protein